MTNWVKGLEPDQWKKAGDTLKRLGARYPILLERPLKPLAIGTSDRLIRSADGLELTEADIKLAMIRHTRSQLYLDAVARGGARYNLDGEIEGEVDPSQAAYSRVIIDRRRARYAAAAARRETPIATGQPERSGQTDSAFDDHANQANSTRREPSDDEGEADEALATRPPDAGEAVAETARSTTEDWAA